MICSKGLDSRDPLDLNRNPTVLTVTTHQVDRADVRGPLAADQPQPLAAPMRLLSQQLLQMRLDPVLCKRRILIRRAHVMQDVGEHLFAA